MLRSATISTGETKTKPGSLPIYSTGDQVLPARAIKSTSSLSHWSEIKCDVQQKSQARNCELPSLCVPSASSCATPTGRSMIRIDRTRTYVYTYTPIQRALPRFTSHCPSNPTRCHRRSRPRPSHHPSTPSSPARGRRSHAPRRAAWCRRPSAPGSA
jgi:hypothetical protein